MTGSLFALTDRFLGSLAPTSVQERPLLPRASVFGEDPEQQLLAHAAQVQGEATHAQAENQVAHAFADRAPLIGVALGVATMCFVLSRRGNGGHR